MRGVLVVLVLLLILVPVTQAQGPIDFTEEITTDQVMAHIEALSVNIGARQAGTDSEAAAADYITGQFESWGYEVEIQEFEFPDGGASLDGTSRNVIAVKPGADDQMVVIGAHMDSVTDGTGADDNASGVAVMLAAAEALATVDTQHTLVFVAFGAEEVDLNGSDYFVTMLADDVENVIAMINIDTVGIGTHLNVYAGAEVEWTEDSDEPTLYPGETWVRDLALGLADEMGLPFGTSAPDYWGGYTGDWSDHYAFVEQGVPIAYFEAWQWENTDDPWWGQETPDGDYLHSGRDQIENIIPEKVEMTAEVVTATAYAIATDAE
jgi:Zn-dependent M28 family amino/carboxypeptidase